MSLLWVRAVINGADYGEPTPEYVDHISHEYQRKHYDETHPDDPDLHDHFYKRPNGTHIQEVAWSSCKLPCQHKESREHVKSLAQQNWDISHRELLDPAAHVKAQDEARERMSGFLSDYALDHPDRVHTWNQDGSLGEHDDPRLKGS